MCKILIVEDQQDIRDNVAILLDAEGYEVLEACNGEEGAKLAIAELPDLILCDVMMPKMNGYEMLKLIRGQPDLFLTPFIFLSAKADKQDRQMGMELGADDYLIKPASRDELLGAVVSRLERSQLTRQFLSAKQTESLEEKEAEIWQRLLRQIPNSVGNLLNKGMNCFYLLEGEEDEQERQRLRQDGAKVMGELYALWVEVQQKMSKEAADGSENS